MKSKIEKLERVKVNQLKGMMGEVSPQWVAKELNKIIDHINSQDQEENSTVCEGCGKIIASRFIQSYENGDGMHYYCLSCDPEKQDIPEEKKDWKEEIERIMREDRYRAIRYKTGIYNYKDKLEEATTLIQAELDRAREEGGQEGWKECEEFYGDMREILRPYHREGEDYRTTLKRQLKLLEEENGKQNER